MPEFNFAPPAMKNLTNNLYIGLMSGTSLDGVDGVLVALPDHSDPAQANTMRLLASAYIPFADTLRADVMALQQSGADEIHREALAANMLVRQYAACVNALLEKVASFDQHSVRAIGVHGQTIRHRPELGYTRQTNNPALLAELSGIDVIADFRSRDVAAGGQGAPLVPAFHRAIFGQVVVCRVVANIGGISNISILRADGSTTGFDTGPGNVLMDAWIAQHHAKSYDENGAWAAQGQVHTGLLAALCDEAFLQTAPPKSTGRDLFRPDWLNQKLQLSAFADISAVDVQTTLCAFTATTLVDAILNYAPDVAGIYICGGGAYNQCLMQHIESTLRRKGSQSTVASTEDLGVSPHHVEALAFAWLAQQFVDRSAGNLPEVTGAKGLRILGALYPA
ncbi:anhydro-N-acetylmuramic acid kinase [Undibacterium sp. RTI2.1]|uniref:anhydro-N-acetylmuramic acid kinase n=1 Tax=unclassified Undibacterium TaxID=2630295 RepID=UPI002B2325A0|nr:MULTISPECIES: anhydro-N-acetylmuramic acid kinase [unclassified Undibacterium]MEB0030952.1 anhydro-N-acetylmuramic acid kinase [Undibacterium sp. RTI2.1]